MKKVKINLIIDILMLLAFISCSITGIIKLPIILNYLDFFEFISYEFTSNIHDFSGTLLVLLIIIHVVLHKKHFWRMIKMIKKKNVKREI